MFCLFIFFKFGAKSFFKSFLILSFFSNLLLTSTFCPLVLLTYQPFHISVASLPCRPVLHTLLLPSLPTGHIASFLPGPRAHFLFVLAQGATCPKGPTAWSQPAVSTWHSMACRAGLHLQRQIHTDTRVDTHGAHTRAKRCHLPFDNYRATR